MAAKIELMVCPVETFDAQSNFGHWKEKMENFFRVIKVADIVANGFIDPSAEEEAAMTTAQKNQLEQNRVKDELAKMWITMRVNSSVYEKIMHAQRSKDMWDKLISFYQGNARVKAVRLQGLRRQFELLEMGKSETVSDYFSKVFGIVNLMKANGESMTDDKIVAKILRTLTPKYNYIVTALEESKDVTTMTVDELMSSLQAHEQKLNEKSDSVVEEALVAQNNSERKDETQVRTNQNAGRGVQNTKAFNYNQKGHNAGRGGRGGRGRGRFGPIRGGPNHYSQRGEQQGNGKFNSDCWNCGKFGHRSSECRFKKGNNFNCDRRHQVNVAHNNEDKAETLLMACTGDNERIKYKWYLDTGCSNHMNGLGKARKGLNFQEVEEREIIKKIDTHNGETQPLSESDRLGKSETDIQSLKEALSKLEAEKEAGLIRYNETLERLSKLESEVSQAKEDSKGLNERASKAEAQVESLKETLEKVESEREASLLEYRRCLDRISNLESSISRAEEDAGHLEERASKAEKECESMKEELSRLKAEKEALLSKYMESCKSVLTPVEERLKLSKVDSSTLVNPSDYKRLVGSLRYLAATRPDITFGVGLVSRFMEAPRKSHLEAAKRILRYVKGTLDEGIFYSSAVDASTLVGYTDSDWGGDLESAKSTSGYVFSIGSGVVSWSSKKQQVVALSTAEAEYTAATSCATQAVWLRGIMESLRHEQVLPTRIFCDNKSALALTKNPVFHFRTKHIHVKFHYIRDLVNKGEIEIVYCRTGDQVADILTKPLKTESFVKLKRLMGMTKFSSLT